MCSSGYESEVLPVWRLSDDSVEHEIARLDADEARLVARRAQLLAEAQVRTLHNRTQASTPDRWLRDRYRWSTRTAGARLREAGLLLGQPAVLAALAGGSVTAEQATVIASTMTVTKWALSIGRVTANKVRKRPLWSSFAAS